MTLSALHLAAVCEFIGNCTYTGTHGSQIIVK